eukprot:NODE_2872_length_1471_cov_49.068991_g2484_i0.p1 GENE.NODE_2872_length_1471_cov_49.068991_g2484_i0~~NODE_2872_length_1471_cov_49.068991_g2484_i0.p1  ORF type:complete len:364 (+),score=71.91 NODE_2872_length_1471_cov_49.068991_g2484_i0:145-1092(+)
MDLVNKDFSRVIYLDVPGNGRSKPAEALKREKDPQVISDMYVEMFEGWRQASGLEEMFLVGHSFGGFISVLYTHKFPDRVRRLVLVAPGGQLPIAGPDTWKCAVFFTMTPICLFRFFGGWCFWLYRKTLWSKLGLNLGDKYLNYYFQLNTSSIGCADVIISRFLEFPAWNECFWTYPVVGFLRDLQCPLAMVWGEDDPVVDVQTAHTLRDLVDHVDLYVLKKAGHNPAHSSPQRFADVLREILDADHLPERYKVPNPFSSSLSEGSSMYIIMKHLVESHMIGCFNVEETKKRREAINEHLCGLAPTHTRGRLFYR